MRVIASIMWLHFLRKLETDTKLKNELIYITNYY